MRKVFWDSPYQINFNTYITLVNNNEVLLNETIAYSFSGGQESDRAWINEHPVLNSRMEGSFIFYTLAEHHGLRAGEQVIMKIDWDRRLKLMRLHFAAELILEIITQKFQLEKIGAHIAEDKARIDFKFSANISSVFDEVLAQYNPIIEQSMPIQTGFLDISTQRRFWKIEGFAQVPCGGTHVHSTAEVGFVALKRVNLGKNAERIEMRLVD
jgi:Ser-tRNA(Ala) deacylase AlaX